jgi:hypothetical protein
MTPSWVATGTPEGVTVGAAGLEPAMPKRLIYSQVPHPVTLLPWKVGELNPWRLGVKIRVVDQRTTFRTPSGD